MGMAGLFLLATLDSSFIPLPIPGATDLLLVILAARHHAWLGISVVASAGAMVGGGMTYHLGKAGGMRALEKYVPKKYLKDITSWTEKRGFLAVAVPALLPPPVPLTPFLIAAGVLRVPQKKFYAAFALSRMIRYGLAAWLGYRYGRPILHVWTKFSREWSMPLLIALWAVIIVASAWGIYKLIKRVRSEAHEHISA